MYNKITCDEVNWIKLAQKGVQMILQAGRHCTIRTETGDFSPTFKLLDVTFQIP